MVASPHWLAMNIEKWRIAGATICVLLALLLSTLLFGGTNDDSLRLLIRITAQTSVTLFLAAFGASSLRSALNTEWTTWLLRNRRYIGVSFAISHFTHLGLIFALAYWFPDPFLSESATSLFTVGGAAYVVIAAMTVTSFDGPRRWLGQRKWSLLHTIGGYFVLFIFAQSYVPKMLTAGGHSLVFGSAILLVVALRLARIYKQKFYAART